jgi:Mg/Co/Ni transporter MgtE
MELNSLTPAEIRTYPLNDLSNNDIRLVLGFLSPSDLTKVLLNIPQENLLHIRDALTPVTFDQMINKLSETDKTKVENRLSSVSIN